MYSRTGSPLDETPGKASIAKGLPVLSAYRALRIGEDPLTLYKRPWYALAMQLPGLETTLNETQDGPIKRYVIQGKPELRSLAWVAYGPLSAVVGVIVMGIAAWALQVSDQTTGNKIAFACVMFSLPVIFWFAGGWLASKLMEKPLLKQREAHTETVEITIDTATQSIAVNEEPSMPFTDVSAFKLVTDAGFDYEATEESSPMATLIMDTRQGQITLVRKALGTSQQKQQLASKLRAAVDVREGGEA